MVKVIFLQCIPLMYTHEALIYFIFLSYIDPSDCNSQKVDGAHARLENAFNKMMDKIDKDVIRQNYVS